MSAVSQLSNDVGYISAESDPVFRTLSSSFLTAHQSLSGYYRKSETSSASQLEAAISGKADAASTLSGYGISDARIDGGKIMLGGASLDTSAFLTAESAFEALSSTFLTAHQSLSGYQPAGDYVSAESDPVFRSLSGNFLTAESDPVFKSLSGNFLTAEFDPVFCKLSSNFLTAESDPVFRSLSSNFLTAE